MNDGWLTGKVNTGSNFITSEIILSVTSLTVSQHN